MNLENIILDIAILIAQNNEDAWYKMFLLNKEFANYVHSECGIQDFISRFQKVEDNRYYLLGKLHRNHIDDLPAVSFDGVMIWYRNGLIHRDNDLPAYIDKNNMYIYYQQGEVHRDNDLPAKIKADYLLSDEQLKSKLLKNKDNNFHTNFREWWLNGNGWPAICMNTCVCFYYINGVKSNTMINSV